MTQHTTPEQLGSDATDDDAARYDQAIDAMIDAGWDKNAAIDWLWGNGDFVARQEQVLAGIIPDA